MATRLAVIDADSIMWNTAYYNRDNEVPDWIAYEAYFEKILRTTGATEYCAFIGAEFGSGISRRKLIASSYKANRPPKPEFMVKHERSIREFSSSRLKFQAVPPEIEADDACAIAASIFKDTKEVIICGIDKDLKQIPGNHYNYVKDEFDHVIDSEADLNLFRQVLTGDSIDGISGIPGIGPTRANKILADRRVSIISSVEVREDLYQRVIREFVSRYGVRQGLDLFAETYQLVSLDSTYPMPIVINKFEKHELFSD
jgi:DNA polymerase-1